MDDKQSTEDIRSALWHIASALKGIELKLDQLETTAEMLVSISNYVEEFVAVSYTHLTLPTICSV